jgi:hypothetical protein
LRLAAAFSAANAHPPAPAGNTGHSALKSNADSNEKADLEAVHDLSLRGLTPNPLDPHLANLARIPPCRRLPLKSTAQPIFLKTLAATIGC